MTNGMLPQTLCSTWPGVQDMLFAMQSLLAFQIARDGTDFSICERLKLLGIYSVIAEHSQEFLVHGQT